MIYPVIMCGGSGTRLWPLSRKSYPKQFTQIIGKTSLFQQSILRVQDDIYNNPTIITANDFRFIITEQLSQISIKANATIIEPSAKNTAPAILACAAFIAKEDEDALILIMPSDHIINNMDEFNECVKNAIPEAINGNIVTFGIKPNSPETGYGYIEVSNFENINNNKPLKTLKFVEKPNLEKAKEMLAANKFLWNAGIFLFKASTILKAFEEYENSTKELVEQAVLKSFKDLDFIRLDEKVWQIINSNSIDYSIMEKANNIVTMPYNSHWTDLGSWDSVWNEMPKDSNQNAVSENANAIECTNTLLRSESGDLELIGIGLDDIIAIAMPDAVIVAKKSDNQKVKDAVTLLKQQSKKQAETFPISHRPWGWYETLSNGDNFQVKRIFVKPKSSISLQSHSKRSEHWVIVSGVAKVTLGNELKIMNANQSIYIPMGEIHRLENDGDTPVILIEVQTGDYLGEDDIIRHSDAYHRN